MTGIFQIITAYFAKKSWSSLGNDCRIDGGTEVTTSPSISDSISKPLKQNVQIGSDFLFTASLLFTVIFSNRYKVVARNVRQSLYYSFILRRFLNRL